MEPDNFIYKMREMMERTNHHHENEQRMFREKMLYGHSNSEVIEYRGQRFLVKEVRYSRSMSYDQQDLELIISPLAQPEPQPQENKMNRSATVFLVNKDVIALSAKYEEGGKVEYFKTFDKSIKKDDLLVVQSGTRHGFTVVKAIEVGIGVDIEDNTLQIKWVVSKLDLTRHEEILVQEEQAVDAVKKAEFNKKRRELMDNIASPDDIADIKALPIYKNGTPSNSIKEPVK